MENRQQAERNNMLLKKLYQIVPEQKDFNDIGFAAIYGELFFDELRYNITAKEWYFYDGIRWREDTGGMEAAGRAKTMYKLLKLYAAKIEDEKISDTFMKHILSYSGRNKRVSLVRDAEELLKCNQNDFDNSPDLFNCLNVTLDLKTMQPHEHRAADMITLVSGCNYDPEASGERWRKFISEIMQGDKEKARYLQRICGYFLTAETSLKAAFFFYGQSTNNGKTVFIEAFRAMMSEYSNTIPPEILAQTKNKGGNEPTPQIAKLQGTRFLSITEIPKQMNLNGSFFKALTGSDTITARFLHQNDFEFKPQFKICVVTNYLPTVLDDTISKSERVRIMTFDRSFTPEEQDKNLISKLSTDEELSGILNWSLQGLADFKKNGEKPPKCVISSTRLYESQSDKIKRFFDECMQQNPFKNTAGSLAYETFCSWCRDSGFNADLKTAFYKALRDRGLMKQRATIEGKTVDNVIIGYEILV